MSAKVWQGAKALERFLVPIGDLEPWPGNARRGDVAAIRATLRRFGQVKPILKYEGRIVAGHHVVLAAKEEGWTHIAALEHEFASEEEARAFLLADNRTSDLSRYEDELLLEQLKAAQEIGLEGTGFSDAFVADLDARLKEAFSPATEAEQPRLDERSEKWSSDASGFEVPLLLGDERLDFARWVKLLEREWGVKGVTLIVVRAVREAALNANSS